MSSSNPSAWRGRLIMIVVVLMFAVPPIVAWVMLTGTWRPGDTVNHGEILQPAVELSMTGWHDPPGEAYYAGRWTLVHTTAGPCGEACAELLDKTARARLALDKDAGRVQRLLLLPESAPQVSASAHGGARTVRARIPAVYGLLEDGERMGLSVVDPRGFRILRYETPLDAKGLLEDLERLLRLSSEDIERFQRIEVNSGS